MIEIIKHGYIRYNATCFMCHCQFKYDLLDINEKGRVRCPDCGYEYIHSAWTDCDFTSQIKGITEVEE